MSEVVSKSVRLGNGIRSAGTSTSTRNPETNFGSETSAQWEAYLERRGEIVRRAAKLMDKIENEHKGEELLHEWRKVSRIFDQVFFLLIFVFNTLVTVIMLLCAPRFTKRTLEDYL